MQNRLTYKKNGRWMAAIVTPRGQHVRKPIKPWNPLLNFYRVVDRVAVGKDNGRNHW